MGQPSCPGATQRARRAGAAAACGLLAGLLASSPALAAATPPITASFLGKANHACAGFTASLHRAVGKGGFPYAHFDPASPQHALLKKVGRYFDKGVGVTKSVPGALRALGTPSAGRTTWHTLLGLVEADTKAAVQEARSATAGNAKGFIAAYFKTKHVVPELNQLAHQAGFRGNSACARWFG